MADPANVRKNGQANNPLLSLVPLESESESSNHHILSILPDQPPPTTNSGLSNTSPKPKPKPKQPQLGPPVAVPPSSTSSGRHPVYRGIRCRSGKWVSEIREPRKTRRIWLGTYPTPEMAAAAYDVAALALKGPDAALNFPDSLLPYSVPASPTAADIRSAAANAAASRATKLENTTCGSIVAPPVDMAAQQTYTICCTSSSRSAGEEFIDEEALFDMPNLLADMAEGMLVSPPRLKSDDSPENSDGESLWSYPR